MCALEEQQREVGNSGEGLNGGWGLTKPRPPAPGLGPALQVQGEEGKDDKVAYSFIKHGCTGPRAQP